MWRKTPYFLLLKVFLGIKWKTKFIWIQSKRKNGKWIFSCSEYVVLCHLLLKFTFFTFQWLFESWRDFSCTKLDLLLRLLTFWWFFLLELKQKLFWNYFVSLKREKSYDFFFCNLFQVYKWKRMDESLMNFVKSIENWSSLKTFCGCWSLY